MRDRLEELDANKADDDETDYLSLLPRALEWQRWLLIHALELLDEPGAVFRFRTVLLLVARQNGKSILLTALILWRMFQDGAPLVLETHASLEHAAAAWEEAVAVADAIPELADDIRKITNGTTSKLLLLDTGERFRIASANRRGGRGFRGDLIIFDELREHQTWAAWSATSKTAMARRRAQVWGVSNAGDASSVVLRHLRAVALAAIEGKLPPGVPAELANTEALQSIGLFEWSAGTIDGREDGTPRSVWDREGWAQANPSMGYTELDERAIATAAFGDPEWEFRTEVLCQFVNSAGSGPFPTGAWANSLDLKADRAARGVTRDTTRPAAYGIDMSDDRTRVYICMAYWDTEDRIRVQLVAQRAGPDWVIPWLKSPLRTVKAEHVALQTKGAPISSLRQELIDAGIPVTSWEGSKLAEWHGTFFDLVKTAVLDETGPAETPEATRARIRLTHGDQPMLDVAATTASIKVIGDGGWAIDRVNSTQDAAPLVSAIAAVGLLLTNPVPTRSAYEDRDLMVV